MMTHDQEVVGSIPGAVDWMDIFSYWYVLKIIFLFEKTKNKQKKRPGLTAIYKEK